MCNNHIQWTGTTDRPPASCTWTGWWVWEKDFRKIAESSIYSRGIYRTFLHLTKKNRKIMSACKPVGSLGNTTILTQLCSKISPTTDPIHCKPVHLIAMWDWPPSLCDRFLCDDHPWHSSTPNTTYPRQEKNPARAGTKHALFSKQWRLKSQTMPQQEDPRETCNLFYLETVRVQEA